ncbi:MAG: branched-chain amino acid transporter permease [Frankiales bacterium]|nr:branched-chain amino acid transporter permease [Frankiales bacterium]
MGQVLVLGLIAGGIYALFALGVVLVYRGTGVLTFAQGEIGTVSLYFAAYLVVDHGASYYLAAPLAIALAAAVGAVFYLVFVKWMKDADPVTTAVATVGLALFLLSGEVMLFGQSPKDLPTPFTWSFDAFGVVVRLHQVLAIVIALALGFGLQAMLRRTDFGLGILASAQDPAAARLVGVPLSRVQLTLWSTGAALSGVAALLVEPTVGIITPGYASELFVGGLAAAVIGGLTSLPGAVVGGVLLGITQAAASRLLASHGIPGLDYIVTLALVLVALLIRAFAPELRSLRGRAAAPAELAAQA